MHVVAPARARKLATIAKEAGAVVHAGPLRRPSETGDWQLGDTDLGEHLWQYSGQQVVLIVAPVEEAAAILCQVCAYPLDAAGACPRCALRAEVAALRRVIEATLRTRDLEARLFWLDDKTY